MAFTRYYVIDLKRPPQERSSDHRLQRSPLVNAGRLAAVIIRRELAILVVSGAISVYKKEKFVGKGRTLAFH